MGVTLRRALAATIAGALLVLEAAVPVQAAEPGHPTGTFTLDHRVGYLHEIDWEDGRWYTETFKISASSLTDDETAPEDLVMEKSYGDGRGFFPADFPCSPEGYECAVGYSEAGTFTPQVRITDEDGNSTTIDLPTITMLRDYTPPVVRLTKPPPRKVHRISAWRVIRGTVTDAGVGGTYRDDLPDGIYQVQLKLLQKRGARWWYYGAVANPRPGAARFRWFRGLRTEVATFDKIRSERAAGITDRVDGIRWQTPWIKGLTRGRLVVRINAADWNSNETAFARYASVPLTRR